MTRKYRIRFTVDEYAQFEEANGNARPYTEEEYAADGYMACTRHPTSHCTCAPKDRTLRPVTYEEYLEYYGDPDSHMYLQSEVQRQCACCQQWQTVGGVGHIDFMFDSPEAYITDRWYSPEEVGELPGYLQELAREDLAEAQAQDEAGDAATEAKTS